jgi:multisubunit Na+/H+ antiporter MnhB subunit
MELIQLILVFALVGFCLYLVMTYIPMPEPMKQVLVVFVVIVLVLWIASFILGGSLSFPRLR